MLLKPLGAVMSETDKDRDQHSRQVIANKSIIKGGVKEEKERIKGFSLASLSHEPWRVGEVCF